MKSKGIKKMQGDETFVVGSHEYGRATLTHAGPIFDGFILYGGNAADVGSLASTPLWLSDRSST